jgi:hypothetical protein
LRTFTLLGRKFTTDNINESHRKTAQTRDFLVSTTKDLSGRHHCYKEVRTSIHLDRLAVITSDPCTALHALTASRCIFQDNLEDWATEANRMRDVYSKAAFCIAATAAPSSEVGLFFDRDTMKLTPSVLAEATWSNPQEGSDWPIPGSYLFRHEPPNPIFAIDHAPLNQRAWVAQERFLSPRILHFTETILFYV